MRIKDILMTKKQEALMECGAIIDITQLLMMNKEREDCDICSKKCTLFFNGDLDEEIEVVSND